VTLYLPARACQQHMHWLVTLVGICNTNFVLLVGNAHPAKLMCTHGLLPTVKMLNCVCHFLILFTLM